MPAARYCHLLDHSFDLVQSVDPTGRILYVNRAWQHVLGYDLQEARTLQVAQVAWVDSGGTMTLHAKDGRQVCVTGFATDHIHQGRLLYTTAIFRDISLRSHRREGTDRLIADLERALADFQFLATLLPVCQACLEALPEDRERQSPKGGFLAHRLCHECENKLASPFSAKL